MGHLAVEKNRTLLIKLYLEISNLTRDSPPIASFIIRVVCSMGDRKSLIHPEITNKKLKNNDDFVWAIEVPLMGKFIIDIEFLDLKIVPLEVSNEVLESGEETYFPALHVGLDNPSAVKNKCNFKCNGKTLEWQCCSKVTHSSNGCSNTGFWPKPAAAGDSNCN
ncbi:unnamed protein product [Camellia sinensis]